MHKKQNDMLNGSIAKAILYFFFPILLGTFFQQLYNTVDAIVVGNYVGKVALGAVGGTTGHLINLLVGFITGISSGATVVVAQFYGNNNSIKLHKAIKSSMFLGIILGFVISVVGYFLAPSLLIKMNVTADIFDMSLTYMRLYLIGLVPSMIYNSGAGILRAVGDSRRPLYFLIISCLVNIVLDILLVAYIPLGVSGAAIATLASQVISAILTLYVLKRANHNLAFRLRDLGYDKSLLSQIIIIGLPTGLQSCLYSFANVFVQSSVNSYGIDTIAAYTAFGKIDALFWMTSGAFGASVLAFCGQNFGAGNIQRVKKGLRVSLLLDFIISSSIALALYFGGSFFFSLFTNDENVILIGNQILRFLCPWWVLFIVIEVFSSGIRACGDSLVPMLFTCLGVGVFRIIWLLFYPSQNVIETLYCYPLSWIITSILLGGYFLQGGWLKRSLKAREKLMNN